MNELRNEDLVILAKQIKSECDRLIELANKLAPEKVWLTTREFAEIKGLKPKIVSNYVSNGYYKRFRKRGRNYEIHRSELDN